MYEIKYFKYSFFFTTFLEKGVKCQMLKCDLLVCQNIQITNVGFYFTRLNKIK